MPFRKDRIKKLIGFTQDEWEVICKKADEAKLRTGTYIRRMAVQGEIKEYDLKELQNLLNAFRRIGTNVNQIATVVNASGSVYQKDIEDMQEQFKYFDNVMKNYLRELKPKVLL